MSDPINGSVSSGHISPLQYIQTETKNVVVQEDKRTVQDVSDLAKKDGMLLLMLEKQSLRTDTTLATSAAKKLNGGEIKTESLSKSVKLSVAGEGDANKAERIAASAPSVLTSQINITQPNNKSAESSKNTIESTATSASSSTGQARSQP